MPMPKKGIQKQPSCEKVCGPKSQGEKKDKLKLVQLVGGTHEVMGLCRSGLLLSTALTLVLKHQRKTCTLHQ